jgi:hypothetical protein
MSSSLIKCASNISDNFYQILKTNDTCLQMCPLECMSVTYPFEISTSAYPSDYYADVLHTQPKFRAKYEMKYQLGSRNSTTNGSSLNLPVYRVKRAATTTTPAIGSLTAKPTTTTDSSVSPCLNVRSNQACIEVIKTTILKVSVFYTELSYTFIEDSPEITTDTLVGVIGKKLFL